MVTLMLPPEAASTDLAQGMKPVTASAWLAGTQCANFSSTGLSCASAAPVARVAAKASALRGMNRVMGGLQSVLSWLTGIIGWGPGPPRPGGTPGGKTTAGNG